MIPVQVQRKAKSHKFHRLQREEENKKAIISMKDDDTAQLFSLLKAYPFAIF